MEQVFELVRDNPLFADITPREFLKMLSCLEGRVQCHGKDAVILLAGGAVSTVGVVVSGSVRVLREDADGHAHLMAELGRGELFGEVFACADILQSPVTVLAAEDCRVLHLNYRKVITTCSAACPFHNQLIANMLRLLAKKNLDLNQKIELLSRRTTRERLLLYFDQQRRGARRFRLPLSREQLAAYLCVERSAMSAELSRMQRDGLIRYHRNEVELLGGE